MWTPDPWERPPPVFPPSSLQSLNDIANVDSAIAVPVARPYRDETRSPRSSIPKRSTSRLAYGSEPLPPVCSTTQNWETGKRERFIDKPPLTSARFVAQVSLYAHSGSRRSPVVPPVDFGGETSKETSAGPCIARTARRRVHSFVLSFVPSDSQILRFSPPLEQFHSPGSQRPWGGPRNRSHDVALAACISFPTPLNSQIWRTVTTCHHGRDRDEDRS